MIMAVFPYHRYVEDGQMIDLNTFIGNDPAFIKHNYNMNVLDATKYNDKLFISTGLHMPAFVYKSVANILA